MLFLAACDLQPRIVALPDTVGDFISARYPALLADPETQPEIYNSAATDYGVYASPELYGSVGQEDYILYASVNDYVLTPSPEKEGVAPESTDASPVPAPDDYLVVPLYGTPVEGSPTPASAADTITVARGDTLYAISRRTGVSVQDLAELNNLAAPYSLRVGQKIIIHQPIASVAPAPQVAAQTTISVPRKPTTTMVELQTIQVAPGDTLYSLSRQYSVPVNDLAVMNNLGAPFALQVGQKLKVPNLKDVALRPAASASVSTPASQTYGTPPKKSDPVSSAPGPKGKDTATATPEKKTATPQKKISSDPNKKLPSLSARSSSKFSWPVRGKILSPYGAKNSGLFNDGINIAANRGTTVKAAENGVVAYAGNEVKGMGNLVIIQHSGGWMTVYAHMDSMSVRRGTKVSVGQKIGTVGTTGKVNTPQLHFEIRKGTKAYNPSTYLK